MSLIYNATFDSQTRILSLLDKAGNVISSCEVPSKGDPLTLTATADNSSVKLTKKGTLYNGYEVDTGSGWQRYAFGTVINLNNGQSCKWRCSSHSTTQGFSNYVRFVMTGTIEASGNCNSMLSRNFGGITSISGYDYAFYGLFYGCTSLTQAPELPATTLAWCCYYDMFRNCTSLTQAPELPATTLVGSCYSGMFRNCTSLTQAPELPATTLDGNCYYEMFYGCKSLTQAPELPATTLAQECYWEMFRNCTSLTQAPELPATTLVGSCYSSMFQNCTSLTQAPELPATTLDGNCYSGMFSGCKSLTQAPELPATTLAFQCYRSMFSGCSALTEVHISATTTAKNALEYWLDNVASSGTVYANPNFTDLPEDSGSGVPSGWNRFVLGAEDTGTTTTMYHNGASETVRVGTSSYGTCYSAQGWIGFKSLGEMHSLLYTLQEPVPTTMYYNGETTTVSKVDANGADGLTSDGYILNNSLNSLFSMHTQGYTLGAQTPLMMYYYDSPVSACSCEANTEDGFTETMYDVGDGKGYLTIAQQNENGYYLTAIPFTGLTFMATEDNSSVKLTKRGTLSNTYEVNTGNGWDAYAFGTVINLNNGQSCKWRCSAHPTTQGDSNYVQFAMTGTIKATGNCNSMLSSNFKNLTSLSGYDYAFSSMFYGCKSLTQAPELPATTLVRSCYSGMFQKCTSLTQAPELPATTLAVYCYLYMFSGCKSLTQAPELPATTLAQECYGDMFNGCTSLTEVRIAATTTAQNALYRWLQLVSDSGTVYADPNFRGLPTNSVSGVPSGWTRHALADYPNP